MEKSAEKTDTAGIMMRPPIVVVMGHIDHGKTKLLDFIRNTKVVEKEAGGITQAIGAYEAEHKGKKITFIDTPGHEAFSQMRARGAKVADIAILVVSAEEGVKEQTKEAVSIIKEAGLPFVVAVNKIDKPGADPARTRSALAENDVLVEQYGGKVPAVDISAKEGKNVDELLDTLLLVAELEELRWEPALPASGVVIESRTDPKRGKAATLLLRDGTMRVGEFLVINGEVTPVRGIENFLGAALKEAVASMPVMVFGLSETAPPGEQFNLFENKSDAEEFASSRKKTPAVPAAGGEGEEERPILNIILKTDVLGSKEAIEHLIAERLQFKKVGVRILKSEAGDVNESDVKMASSGRNNVIAGFKVKVPAPLRELASAHGVPVLQREIIYELEDDVKNEMLKLAPSEFKRVDLGKAKLLKIFKRDKNKQIIGGRVLEGAAKKGAQFEVLRGKLEVGKGKIASLQHQKRDVAEVNEGLEFGMLVEADIAVAEDDVLSMFEEEKLAPALE